MNEVELLFTEILNCNRVDLYLSKNLHLDKYKSSLLSSALKRRISAEPIQYILGKTEFMGLEFKVNKDVFIPRPETEILVETVLKIASTFKPNLKPRSQEPKTLSLNILDIGTGSGNIGISLAKFLKDCKVVAVDVSKEAIVVARNNALLNGLVRRVDFINQDFFSLRQATCKLQPFSFDFVVSNPPYIPTKEIKFLKPEIKYEPNVALDGGEDGMYFCRGVIKECPRYLKENGYLIMEMGYGQSEAIQDIALATKKFKITEIIKDYQEIERVIVLKRNF